MKTKIELIIFFFILAAFSAVLFFRPSIGTNIYAQRVPVETDTLSAEKLTTLVNEWRVKSGFQPYERSEGLCKIAYDRAMDDFDYHDGFMKKYWTYKSSLQENIVESITNKDALQWWLNSPKHHETLEKPYKYSCIATGKMAVQIFSNCESGCP